MQDDRGCTPMQQLKAQVDRLTDHVDRLTEAMFGAPDAEGAPQGGMASDIRELERAVRVLATANDASTRQVAEVAVLVREQAGMFRDSMQRVDGQDARLAVVESGFGALTAKVEENTGLTAQTLASVDSVADMVSTLRDVQAAGRLGARLARWVRGGLIWLAPAFAAAAGIWALITGKGPKL